MFQRQRRKHAGHITGSRVFQVYKALKKDTSGKMESGAQTVFLGLEKTEDDDLKRIS